MAKAANEMKLSDASKEEIAKIDAFCEELSRLRAVEESYNNLLTLVAVVAKKNDLAMDQHLEIKISKKDYLKSTSWEDLLVKHFENIIPTRLIGGL